jgi:hypothetical protein
MNEQRAVRGGRIYRTDNTIVNEADGLDEQGRQILSGGKAQSAVVITAGEDIEPTQAITANVDTDAQVIFENDTEAVTVKLLAGAVYPYSIIKVAVGADIVGLY